MAARDIAAVRAIVTGASSGIGRSLARLLASHGASLVVVARRKAELDSLVAELPAVASRITLVAGDITDAAVRQEAVAAAERQFGGLDLVVNCAGISALGRFEDASPDRLTRIMEVNFFAAAELIRAALPLLLQGKRPMVVNMGSILGHRGIPWCSEYCASKFALRGFTESLRAELTRHGVDVLLVSPGTTETEFFAHALEVKATPWPRQKGVSADLVAQCTLAAIRKGKREIVVNPRGKLLVWANRLAPWLVDRFMRRYG